jgi:LemA protein
MFDFQVKPNFSVANEQAISTPPTVEFGDSPAPPAPAGAGPGTSPSPVTK